MHCVLYISKCSAQLLPIIWTQFIWFHSWCVKCAQLSQDHGQTQRLFRVEVLLNWRTSRFGQAILGMAIQQCRCGKEQGGLRVASAFVHSLCRSIKTTQMVTKALSWDVCKMQACLMVPSEIQLINSGRVQLLQSGYESLCLRWLGDWLDCLRVFLWWNGRHQRIRDDQINFDYLTLDTFYFCILLVSGVPNFAHWPSNCPGRVRELEAEKAECKRQGSQPTSCPTSNHLTPTGIVPAKSSGIRSISWLWSKYVKVPLHRRTHWRASVGLQAGSRRGLSKFQFVMVLWTRSLQRRVAYGHYPPLFIMELF